MKVSIAVCTSDLRLLGVSPAQSISTLSLCVMLLGPDKNRIVNCLNDVDWESLASQLNLPTKLIEEDCAPRPDAAICRRREIVNRLCDSQESLKEAIKKLIQALKAIGYHGPGNSLENEYFPQKGKGYLFTS